MEGKPLEIKTDRYAPDVPNVFLVRVSLPQKSGPPIVVHLPVYDATATNGVIVDLSKKAFESL
jgi:hypothetical protein